MFWGGTKAKCCIKPCGTARGRRNALESHQIAEAIRAVNQLTFTTICKFRRRLFHTKRGIRSRPERSDGVKYQPENERPNRRSEIGATQSVLIIFLANRIGDRHE